MRTLNRACFAAGAVVVLASGGRARADTTVCTAKITVVPFTINAPGSYCLDKHLSTAATATSNAITINADFVSLDLNGFKLDGSASAPGARKGVYATGRRGIVVRNGVIRGFGRGISLEGVGGGHLADEVRVESNATAGIWLEGPRSMVRNCRVSSIQPATDDTSAVGIFVAGSQVRVAGNDVLDTTATGNGVARSIVVEGADSSVVENNRISNTALAERSTGIFLTGGVDHLLVGNFLSTLDIGLQFGSEAFGKYRDTLTSGVMSPFNGGSDAGNNQ
jgi:hypothetical protein